MKTIEEIKHQIAVENGYKDWLNAIVELSEGFIFRRLGDLENMVINEYARQFCNEQINECAEPFIKTETVYRKILNTPNVVTTNTK